MHTHRFPRLNVRSAAIGLLAILALSVLAACGNASAGSGGTQNVTIGLTYIPNIQFAPFYAADSLGYYKAEGLNVTLRHHSFTEDEFGALVSGKEDMIFAGGDETLQARGHNVPITYVAEVFTQYPVTLIVPAISSIQSIADLRGHTIGVPGPYGATYNGLLALLQSAGLSKSDVTIQSIGFTQVAALLGHKVDAVMGYVNNEVIQFQKAGFATRTFPVTSVQPLISNGLAALQPELANHPDIVRKVIAATIRGVQYVLAHPQDALSLSKKYVPDLQSSQNAASALAVLQATLPVMQPAAKPGYIDPQAWQQMVSFMQSQGLLAGPVSASTSYSDSYLPS
jgi:NitT/TauT family transport system substrate-binding protein